MKGIFDFKMSVGWIIVRRSALLMRFLFRITSLNTQSLHATSLGKSLLGVSLGILLLSEMTAATATVKPIGIAQTPTTSAPNTNSPDQQQAYVRGQQLLQQAQQLFEQGTADSKQQALAKYKEALLIWRQLSDRSREASTLLAIGTLYSSLNDNQSSLDYYQQALAIRRELSDSVGEAIMLFSIGGAYSNLGETQKAIDSYNQALSLFQAQNQPDLAADTLVSLGGIYSKVGETQKALDAYNQALAIHRTQTNRTRQAETLQAIGLIYTSLGEQHKALASYNQALEIQREERNLAGQAETLNQIGILYTSLGQKQQALDSYNQALQLHQAVQGTLSGTALITNSSQQALILMGIAGTYSASNEYQQALNYYNQARSLLQKAGNRAAEAEVLNQMSYAYARLGDNRKALDSLQSALALQRAIRNPAREAFTLGNIADIYSALGEPQKALDYHNQALEIQRRVNDRPQQAATLNHIAQVYSSLGDYQLSIETYTQALEIYKSISDSTGTGQTLDNIGNAYRLTGDYAKALEFYNQELSIWREQGDWFREFATLTGMIRAYEALGDYPKGLEAVNQALTISRKQQSSFGEASAFALMGRVYLAAGDYQKALDVSTQSLELWRKLKIPSAEANVLGNIGKTYKALKQPQKAIATYNQELALRRQLGDRTGEAETLYNVAEAERAQGNLNAARTQIEAVLNIVEDIRTKVTSPELRTSYFASVQKYYQFYIDVLMQLHKQQPDNEYEALALHASERARARSLLELLTEARADIRTGVDPKLLELERTLQQQLDVAEKHNLEGATRNNTGTQTPALEKDIATLLEEYRQVQAKIRATSPRYAALTQPQPLTLAEIQQQVLDEETMLLQYSLGEERSYLWAVTKTSITSYELPKQAEIEALVQQFITLMKTPSYRLNSPRGLGVNTRSGSQPSAVATRLSQILLQPVAGQLGNKRLLIVGDGALQYVPFAALPTPLNKATAYTHLTSSSQMLHLAPPTPQLWGEPEFQSPPELGDLGGEKNLYLHRSLNQRGEGGSNQDVVPLLVNHEIVNLPSVSTIAVLRKDLKGRKPASKAIAVFADPVFSPNDERLEESGGHSSTLPLERRNLDSRALARAARETNITFNRLPFTRREAEQILALVPATSRFQAFDFAANRAIATSPELSQYRIVHFATHGILNSKQPELSGVVLSLLDEKGKPQNGFLRLHDVFNLNLPAEIIVLSACETGLGEEVKGEGLVGLTRGFMYAGSPRVVVSLWSVDDEATSQLMVKFYKKMLQDGLKPAAALRAAQLEMWQQQRWQAPFYWAAFTLQGEWK
jgi:CHAT domain-containing protein/tetratricopeptide (TPR) repeat protein